MAKIEIKNEICNRVTTLIHKKTPFAPFFMQFLRKTPKIQSLESQFFSLLLPP